MGPFADNILHHFYETNILYLFREFEGLSVIFRVASFLHGEGQDDLLTVGEYV